jgi:tRNA 2-selenouridine synthase
MAIEKIGISHFVQHHHGALVIDVRSPAEFAQAHVPGAYSMPLFTDEERKVVGTAYKQQGKQKAIKLGLDCFGVKMRSMVEHTEQLVKEYTAKNAPDTGDSPVLFVHCWRGGMRSAGVAWLLDLYGFKVCTLVGGYKAYRKWVREQFEKPYPVNILGGFTGSGKTEVLAAMKQKGENVIDLEQLANHKGSAFGALGMPPQPTQEMFENLLATALANTNINNTPKQDNTAPPVLWLEDESQRIGNLQIPMPLWHTMRKSRVHFIALPLQERLNYIVLHYGHCQKEKLVNAIIRIQKRLGGLETKIAIGYLLEDNYKACFEVLLKYYDKFYSRGLHNRPDDSSLVEEYIFTALNATEIANYILNHQQQRQTMPTIVNPVLPASNA